MIKKVFNTNNTLSITYDVYGEKVEVSLEGSSPDIVFVDSNTVMSFSALSELFELIKEDFKCQ